MINFQENTCNISNQNNVIQSITLPEAFPLKFSVPASRLKEIIKHEVQRIMGILNQVSL